MHRPVCCALGMVAVTTAVGFAAAQTGMLAGKANLPRGQEPYTAEFKITTVQTLANGTTITRESTEINARDSAGRTLRSITEQTPSGTRASWMRADVNDPVNNTRANWDSGSRTARVTQLPPPDQRSGCWANDSGTFRSSYSPGPRPGAPAPNGTALPGGRGLVPAQRPKPEDEDLGNTTIQGMEVHGRRLTFTIPAGQEGNDQPIVTVSEYWSSRELGIYLRDILDDPRSGKRTREVVNLSVAEPDPSIFVPPEGYEVTTEQLHPVACPTPRQ